MSGSGGSEVIREFLVNIGYQEKGREPFLRGLGEVTKQALKLGAEIKAAALAVNAAITIIAAGMEQLYFASQRTGAAVENIKALTFGLTQMGASAGEARATLENLGRFLRLNPGGEGFLQSLGVQTRTASGALRDTSAMLTDLGTKLRAMPFYQANAYAGVLGIDEKSLIALTQGVGEFSDTYRAMYRAAGIDAQQAARDSHGFMVEIRTLGAAFDILKEKVAVALQREMSLDIRRFREFIVSNFGQITRVIKWVAETLLEASQVMTRLAARTVEAVQDIARWFSGLDQQSQDIILAFGAVVVAWRLLNIAFLTSPLGIILGLGAALLLLYDDYKTWREGGKSLIDWDSWKGEIDAATGGISRIWDAVKGLFHAITDDLWPAVKHLGEQLGLLAKGFTVNLTIKTVIDGVASSITDLVHELTMVVELMAAIAAGDWGKAKAIALRLSTDIVGGSVPSNPGATPEGGETPGFFGRMGQILGGSAPPGAGDTVGSRFTYLFAGKSPPPVGHAAVDQAAAAKESYDFWISKGLTPAGASARVAAEQQESGFDPTRQGDKNAAGVYTAGGLYQWHADRRARILAATGIDVWTASAAQQREAAYQEMALGLDPQAAAALKVLRTTNDPQVATEADVDGIERPGDRSGNKVTRGGIAVEWQRKFAEQAARAAPGRDTATMERLRGLPPGSLSGLEPTPLVPGNVANDYTRTSSPTFNQNTTITVTGNGGDAAQQVIDGQRSVNQDLVRNFQGAAR